MGKVKVTDFKIVVDHRGITDIHDVYIECPTHGTFDEPLNSVQEVVDQMTNHLIKENH